LSTDRETAIEVIAAWCYDHLPKDTSNAPAPPTPAPAKWEDLAENQRRYWVAATRSTRIEDAVDALIAAGFIRETDNTGNDAVGPRCHLHPEGCPPTHRQHAACSSGVADTVKEENR
jgi:hypothetical protein